MALPTRNRNGTEMEPKWNRSGTEMEIIFSTIYFFKKSKNAFAIIIILLSSHFVSFCLKRLSLRHEKIK